MSRRKPRPRRRDVDGTYAKARSWGPVDLLLDEWVLMRSSGVDLVTAAIRIGTTPDALDKALHRATKRGDPRGRHTGCHAVKQWRKDEKARREAELARREALRAAGREAGRAKLARMRAEMDDQAAEALPRILDALLASMPSEVDARLGNISRCECGSWAWADGPCQVCPKVPTQRADSPTVDAA